MLEKLKEFVKYLPENPIIVEAGANDGTDTLNLSRLWPLAKIYAFEPYPRAYHKLKARTVSNPMISTYPIALGTKIGVTDFYVSRNPQWHTDDTDPGSASSFLPPSKSIWPEPLTFFKEIISVPVTTLDAWARQQGVKNVDFLWLDMQGSEGIMLKESPEILDTVKLIQTEYGIKPYYEGSMVFSDLTAFLESKGFKLIYSIGDVFGDAFYLRV